VSPAYVTLADGTAARVDLDSDRVDVLAFGIVRGGEYEERWITAEGSQREEAVALAEEQARDAQISEAA
jgi:hypothetical protein